MDYNDPQLPSHLRLTESEQERAKELFNTFRDHGMGRVSGMGRPSDNRIVWAFATNTYTEVSECSQELARLKKLGANVQIPTGDKVVGLTGRGDAELKEELQRLNSELATARHNLGEMRKERDDLLTKNRRQANDIKALDAELKQARAGFAPAAPAQVTLNGVELGRNVYLAKVGKNKLAVHANDLVGAGNQLLKEYDPDQILDLKLAAPLFTSAQQA